MRLPPFPARRARLDMSPVRFADSNLSQVWDLETLSLRARLTGHEGAVLALQVVPTHGWLISASGRVQLQSWSPSSD